MMAIYHQQFDECESRAFSWTSPFPPRWIIYERVGGREAIVAVLPLVSKLDNLFRS